MTKNNEEVQESKMEENKDMVSETDTAAEVNEAQDVKETEEQNIADVSSEEDTTKNADTDGKKTGNEKKSSKSGKKGKKSIKSLELELKAQNEILDELSVKLKAAEDAKEQAADKYQRLMAEFENMRKRTEKEAKKMYDVGAKDVLEKLLPVVDNFERAQMALTDEQKEDPFVQGIDKIYRQMMEYLTSVKVEPMNAAGKEFNPDFHNAVMHVEDDSLEENVVAEELQKGYMYKDEVLRHSMVKVAN